MLTTAGLSEATEKASPFEANMRTDAASSGRPDERDARRMVMTVFS